jgi:hypothetical protein
MRLRQLVAATILGGIALAVQAAPAGPACDYRIDAELSISDERVQLAGGGHRYTLIGERLLRDGRELALDSDRRRDAAAYRRGIETLVPAVSDITFRGALLALESLALVAAGLSGDDTAIARAVERHERVSLQLRLQLDGRRLPPGRALRGTELEDEIGALAADSAGQLAGGIASFISRVIFDPDTAQARGEYLERLVERRIAPRADALEAAADAICVQLRELDMLEERLGAIDLIRPDTSI